MKTAKSLVPELRFKPYSENVIKLKLGKVASVKTGPFGSLLHENDYVDEGTPIITVEHLSECGIVHKKTPKVSNKDKDRLKKYTLKTDDIVFSRVGSVDRNSIVSEIENGWLFSGRLLRIRCDERKLLAQYLSYHLQQEITKHRIRSVAVGQTMPSLNTEILTNFDIIISPSLPEQQKIASFLSGVDKKIENLTRKKELLQTYKKGLMQKIFSRRIRFKDDDGKDFPDWEEKRLGEVIKILMGQSPDSKSYNQEQEGVYLIQGNADILNRISNPRQWTNEPTKLCKEGDLLLTVRAPVGAIAKSTHRACIGRGVCAITNNKLSNLEFIYQFFLLFEKKWHRIEQGSTFTAISSNDIKSLKVNLPSLPEQQKIASLLSAIDKKIETVDKQLTQMQTFKKGLLQKMFV